MNKSYLYLLISIAFAGMMQAQDANFFKRQYRTVQNDLKLIKQCYFTKSPACTDNERQLARKAAMRVGAEITGLAAALVTIAAGTWYGARKLPFKFMVAKIKKAFPAVTEIELGETQAFIRTSETISTEDLRGILEIIQETNKNIKGVIRV
jgi:hypothetical protein